LTCSVSGILQQLLFASSVVDHGVVDGARADGIDEVEDGLGGLDRLVLPAGDGGGFAGTGESRVDPGDNLGITNLRAIAGELGENGQQVGTHHLPD